MKELKKVIDAEFNSRDLDFFVKNFYWNIYRQNEEGEIPIPKFLLNRLISNINYFWFRDFEEEEDVYSVNDEFLCVFFYDEKSKSDSSSNSSAMTFDEYGFNIYSVHDKPDLRGFKYRSWKTIDHVDFIKNEDKQYFRFYYINSTSYQDINLNLFNIKGADGVQFLLGLFRKIVQHIQWNNQRETDEIEVVFDEVRKLVQDEENFPLALEVLEKKNKAENRGYELKDFSEYYWYKAGCLLNIDEPDEALRTIDYYLSNFPEDKNITPDFLEFKARIFFNKKQFFKSLEFLTRAEELSEDPASKNSIRLDIEEILQEIQRNFLEIPKSERKMIFMSNRIFQSPNGSFIALDMSKLSNLNFPVGHPQLNEIYVVHPRRNDFYLPLNNSLEELTLDRISEFETLMQSLGATYLKISSNKSDINEEKSNLKQGVKVDGGVKTYGLKVEAKKNESRDSFSDLDSKISHTQIFKPYKKPFIPDDLIWYHSDLNWQKLAKQRFIGNLLEHNETISLSQVENVSTQELKTLNVELKAFMAKIGVKYSKDIEIESKSSKKLTWTVSVKFEDIRNLTETNEPTISESPDVTDSLHKSIRAKYREDVLFMLEDDGIIDSVERKLLNKKAEKYSLTKEEAENIENEVLKLSHSEAEVLYIEQLEDLIVDGKIDEDERILLERYGDKYGISEERQKFINDKLLNKNF